MTFGSLFAGIGGFDLGFERAGMECKWQVEIDPFCRKVLAKHWPNVARYEDVRTVGKHNLEWVDVLCGGFPCQDISNAGKRAGIDGERSGLWREFYRIICELRPRYVVVENVAALLVRGMGRVLGNLAEIGYDAEWDSVPASDFIAHIYRDRVFIVAFPAKPRKERHIQWEANRTRGPWSKQQFARLVEDQLRLSVSAGITGGVSVGDAARVDRVGACGNAVVPQVAEWIGRRIIESSEWGRRQGR